MYYNAAVRIVPTNSGNFKTASSSLTSRISEFEVRQFSKLGETLQSLKFMRV